MRTSKKALLLAFKWLLLILDILSFAILCNALLLAPGPYWGKRGVVIIVAALCAAFFTWAIGEKA